MNPMKKVLISSAAVIALMAGPTLAQSTTVDTGTAAGVDSATGSGDAAASTGAGTDTGTMKPKAVGDTAQAGQALDGAASGASDTAQSMNPDAAATADTDAEMTAQAAPATAGELIGSNVTSSAGEDIGEVDDVVRINGEVMAVVGVGGFLGLGEHSVALPLTELDWQGETVTAFGYSEEQLKSMQEFDKELATSVEADEPVTLGKS